MFYVAPKYGRKIVFVYVAICSVIGSLTVMACKGLGIALKQTLGGNGQLANPVAWMLLIGGALCIMVQMNYLNKALDIFNTSIVTPIYYVMFTTFTIVASAILYKEWAQLDAKDSLGSICGFLTIICGVFLLHASLHSLSADRRALPNGETNTLMSEIYDGNPSDEINDSDDTYLAKSTPNKQTQNMNTSF